MTDAIRIERDLYRRILDLGAVPPGEIDLVLRGALDLLMDLTEAARGWIEVRESPGGAACAWSASIGASDEDVEAARHLVSRGIIDEAFRSGRAVRTISAREDPEFRDRPTQTRTP